MKKVHAVLLPVLSILFLHIGCTTKRIVLVYDVDFEMLDDYENSGFVRDSLFTNITLVPESMEYDGFDYSVDYSILQGDGYYIKSNGEVIPEETAVKMRLEDEYTANWKYIGTSAGTHTIQLEAKDNFGREKKITITYEVKQIALEWEAISSQAIAQKNDTIPLQIELTNNTQNIPLTYQYSVRLTEGAGILLGSDKKALSLNKSSQIVPGSLELYYVGAAIGKNTLQFDLETSNDLQKTTALTFTIQEVPQNEPPVANNDEAETSAARTLIIPVLNNDTDPEDDALTITSVAVPNNGTAIVENNQIVYTSNTSFRGKEVFEYTVADTSGSEATATISILVTDRETITIPDDNFERALIALGHDEGPLDNKIFRDIAENITTLNISEGGISDLTGIEEFTNLEELICRNNRLTALDVSKNANLVLLDVQFNDVKTIDLTKNVKLIDVNLWDNNLITIDLSKNVDLERLDITGNILNTLDLRNNPKLNYLNAGYNFMKTVDLSNNLELKYVNLGISPLENIDVSMLNKLEHLGLWTTKIRSVNIKNNINLEFLAVANSTITEIDLLNNIKLETLWLVNTKIDQVNISANKNLTDLRLDKNNLVSINLRGLKKIDKLDTQGNTSLSCIQVDDVSDANNNKNWEKDTSVFYALNCR